VSSIYLITGPSGSGKTTLSNYLTGLGHTSIDADSAPGICYHVNQAGKPVPYPADADASWWETHHYVWELSRLRRLIGSANPTDGLVFVCGNAGNIDQARDMFEAVYYLDIPQDSMIQRLQNSDRDHSFGRRIVEQDLLLSWVDGFKAEMLELGATVIDATQPVAKVTADILGEIRAH